MLESNLSPELTLIAKIQPLTIATCVQQFHIDDLAILIINPSNTQLKIIINESKLSGAKQVDVFSDCEKALEAMQTYQPDLVAIAMYYRDRTGLELLMQMREHP